MITPLRVWVVFNNDLPLAFAYTEEQAERDVAYRRKHDTDPKLPGSNVTRNYFHWHDVPVVKTPLVVLRRTQADLLEACLETDGCELWQSDWSVAEQLAEKGLVQLGSARGPDRAWRRLELTELGRLVAELRRGGV